MSHFRHSRPRAGGRGNRYSKPDYKLAYVTLSENQPNGGETEFVFPDLFGQASNEASDDDEVAKAE